MFAIFDLLNCWIKSGCILSSSVVVIQSDFLAQYMNNLENILLMSRKKGHLPTIEFSTLVCPSNQLTKFSGYIIFVLDIPFCYNSQLSPRVINLIITVNNNSVTLIHILEAVIRLRKLELLYLLCEIFLYYSIVITLVLIL